MKNLFLATLVLIALVCSSCDSTEPVDNRELKLALVNSTLTEISLKLTTIEIELPANITINKNSTSYKQIILKSNDSTFTADSLQPNTSYTFQAVLGEVASEIVTAKTIGTTSQDLILTVEDQSSTELWVSLKTGNIILPTNLTLALDSNPITQFSLTDHDTLIYIDSLQPGTSYSLEVIYGEVKSESRAAQTLGTTSHNFTIETFTFGEQSSSRLFDVAIIDENNIWAVGEIYLEDTTGGSGKHNLAKWDGQNWSVIRVPYYYQGQANYNTLNAVFAFNMNEIWLAGNGVLRWDGAQFNEMPTASAWGAYLVNKVWGSSSNNIFIVGTQGKIANYNGSNWQRIESGTNVDIKDIWGSYDIQSGKSLILCAVTNRYEISDHKILSIDEQNQVDSISWNTGKQIHSIWFDSDKKLHATGHGVFFSSEKDKWVEQAELPFKFSSRIRGNAKNDLFVVGDFGLVAHFNGVDWQVYNEAAVAKFYSLDYKGNTMVAVGDQNGKAVVLVMKKN